MGLRAVIQELSVNYLVRSVDMMLSRLYMTLRGSTLDATGASVDLSKEIEWQSVWKGTREACSLEREGMEWDE